MELINKLDQMFVNRYQNLFTNLNKNIVKVDIDADGIMTVPVVSLGEGGATIAPVKSNAFTLNPPAKVDVVPKKVLSNTVVYRLAISFSEAETAIARPDYFNYLIDNILEKALSNYNKAFGGPDVQRLGQYYCVPFRPNGSIFTELESGDIEFRLYGQWATNTEVGENNEQGN